MRHVQSVALDLFERHGFDAVTVADVAAAAEVAERTVFRHFGTKEMLVAHDDADAAFLAQVADRATATGLLSAVRDVAARIPPGAWTGWTDPGATWRRKLHLLRSTPSLAHVLDEESGRFGDLLARAVTGSEHPPFVARARGRAVAAALTAAITAWAEGPEDDDLRDRVLEALAALESLDAR